MLRGMDVTVVHLMPWLMERQLDDAAGKLLQKSLEDARPASSCSARRREALIARRATAASTAVQLQGRHARSPADLVVMAVGIRPEHRARREAAGLHCNRGIVVNDTMQTLPTRASTRSANARRTAASPTAWWRRCSSMAKVCANHLGAVRHRPLRRLADLDQAQGHRHRPVLRRRLHGRRRHRGDRAVAIPSAASTRSW